MAIQEYWPFFEFSQVSFRNVNVKFSDKQASEKAIRSYIGRETFWVLIERCEAEIPLKKGSASPSIKHTQFPLILAWASTVLKV